MEKSLAQANERASAMIRVGLARDAGQATSERRKDFKLGTLLCVNRCDRAVVDWKWTADGTNHDLDKIFVDSSPPTNGRDTCRITPFQQNYTQRLKKKKHSSHSELPQYPYHAQYHNHIMYLLAAVLQHCSDCHKWAAADNILLLIKWRFQLRGVQPTL